MYRANHFVKMLLFSKHHIPTLYLQVVYVHTTIYSLPDGQTQLHSSVHPLIFKRLSTSTRITEVSSLPHLVRT